MQPTEIRLYSHGGVDDLGCWYFYDDSVYQYCGWTVVMQYCEGVLGQMITDIQVSLNLGNEYRYPLNNEDNNFENPRIRIINL